MTCFVTNSSFHLVFLKVPYELRLGRVRLVTLAAHVRLLTTMFAKLMHPQIALSSKRLVAVRLIALKLSRIRMFILLV